MSILRDEVRTCSIGYPQWYTLNGIPSLINGPCDVPVSSGLGNRGVSVRGLALEMLFPLLEEREDEKCHFRVTAITGQ